MRFCRGIHEHLPIGNIEGHICIWIHALRTTCDGHLVNYNTATPGIHIYIYVYIWSCSILPINCMGSSKEWRLFLKVPAFRIMMVLVYERDLGNAHT